MKLGALKDAQRGYRRQDRQDLPASAGVSRPPGEVVHALEFPLQEQTGRTQNQNALDQGMDRVRPHGQSGQVMEDESELVNTRGQRAGTEEEPSHTGEVEEDQHQRDPEESGPTRRALSVPLPLRRAPVQPDPRAGILPQHPATPKLTAARCTPAPRSGPRRNRHAAKSCQARWQASKAPW